MSRTVISFQTVDAFTTHNPWFYLALEQSFNDYIRSDRVKNVISREISDKFPALFQQYASDSKAFQALTDRLHTVTDSGVQQINQATENRVTQLVSNDNVFNELKTHIYTASMDRYRIQEREFDKRFEKKESDRNSRLEQLERDVSRLQWCNNILGGSLVATGVFAILKFYQY